MDVVSETRVSRELRTQQKTREYLHGNSGESIAPDSFQESSWLVWFSVVEKRRDSGVA